MYAAWNITLNRMAEEKAYKIMACIQIVYSL